jgi:hypothetical protein
MHRTLTSKTPQHKARHPQSSDKHKRKKRKNRTKGRIRISSTTQHGRASRDDQDELLVDECWTTTEKEQPAAPSFLPPLVEDKPMLDTIHVRTTPQLVEMMITTTSTRLRSDSVDSNFEDASSCETSVSSASAATTPNRLHNEPSEQQQQNQQQADLYQPVNNARGRFRAATKSEATRGQGTASGLSRHHKSEEMQKVSGPSRWDALKPEGRAPAERHAPPHRASSRSGRNDVRNQRQQWKRQNNKKHFPPAFVDPVERCQAVPAPSGIDENNPKVPLSMTAALPTSFTTVPNNAIGNGAPIGHSETALYAESPTWSTTQNSTPFLPPPPGLNPPISKEIPFGCGSSDDGNSAPPSPFCHEPASYLNMRARRFQPSFGAIGPAFPSPGRDGRTDNAHSCLLDSSFDAASISFRSSAVAHTFPTAGTNNPFASIQNNDDDTIEAQLQELGGQMVCSILDF